MAIKNRLKTEPIPVVRQSRSLRIRSVTTAKPGKVVPIAAFNLLREDSCTGRLNVAVEMAETYEVLMNRMMMRLTSVFIPHIAEPRFERSDAIFERSYAGEKKTDDDNAVVVPFIETKPFPATAGSHAVYKALGLSAKAGALVNTSYEHAYNLYVNYARRMRSNSLPQREVDDTNLAAALWGPSAFSDVVPDFDDGMIAGELPVTVVQGKAPIFTDERGAGQAGANDYVSRSSGGTIFFGNQVQDQQQMYADLFGSSVGISLANIDQARELVRFAQWREGYEGHPDEYVIDAMMQGFDIESLQWFEPMVIDTKMVDIPQMRRMATDGGNLEDGVANGVISTSVGVNVPPNRYGGVVMVFAEFLPEQLYERQADPWFTAKAVADLPHYMNDVTNPMPVVQVLNGEVDVDHDQPDELFGYGERNRKWRNWPTRVGGDLYAPNADAATAVARRVIYPTDVENPGLTQEFYLATTLGLTPFVATDKDPLVIAIGGTVGITGLTVIGEVHESEANYEKVRAQVPPFQPIKE